MITSVMATLRVIVSIIIIFFVAYIIIKILACKEQHQIVIESEDSDKKKKSRIQVEIKSNDLYMEAENLIATHDVYALQVDDITNKIDMIEDKLDKWRKYHKLYNKLDIDQLIMESVDIISDTEAEFLVSKSLKLQEQKCKLEAKMLKIMKQLDNIAKEELRRQANK